MRTVHLKDAYTDKRQIAAEKISRRIEYGHEPQFKLIQTAMVGHFQGMSPLW